MVMLLGFFFFHRSKILFGFLLLSKNERQCGSFLKAERRKASFQKGEDACSTSWCCVSASTRVLLQDSFGRGRACTNAAGHEV